MDIKKLTVKSIKSMSYTTFVGLINQWNVLPGAYTTLIKWINFSRISKNSKILEVACTTGFSSREIALITGCSGLGFDLSEASVKAANLNKKIYAPKIKFEYIQSDGYQFTTKKKFTHIIFGAALRFFPDPQKMLARSFNFLEDMGHILSSEFYAVKKIPESLIKTAEKTFDFTPTEIPYKEVMKMYQGLEIIYEDKNTLTEETEKELQHYCRSTVDRAAKRLNIRNQTLYQSIYNRLYEVKKVSNLLRLYQNYNVLITRYRKSTYPDRYIELF